MAARETGHLVPISANGHGTPTPPPRPRVVAEEKAAPGIGAGTHSSLCAFHNDFRGGTRDGREQPIETAFTSHEFHLPGRSVSDQFIVPFGNAQDLVNGFGPLAKDRVLSDHGAKRVAQGIAKAY